MKTAYELAMERLEKESPSGKQITNEQKAEIAELQNIYQSKIAERKILAEDELKKVAGDYAAMQQAQAQMQEDLRRLEAELEEKKNEVRNR